MRAQTGREGGASMARGVRQRRRSSAGGGVIENERGNLANVKERGEHEHQWLT